MHHKLFVALAAPLLASLLSAQTEMRLGSLSSGTGRLTGGGYELGSSAGLTTFQSGSTGAYEMRNGFWPFPPPANLSTVSRFDAVPGLQRIWLTWRSSGSRASAFRVSRGVTRGGPFVSLASIPAGGAGTYSHLDATVQSGTRYFYLLSEEYAGGGIAIRAMVESAAFGSSLAPGVARVGPGAYPDIAAAIAAAPPRSVIWTVLVDLGVYPGFRVTSSAPSMLQITGDGTGIVQIDGAIEIAGRGAQQQTFLANLILTSSPPPPLPPSSALRILGDQGVTVVDRCTIRVGGQVPAVFVQNSRQVALQGCRLVGSEGLLLVGSSASLIKSETTGLALRSISNLQIGEVVNSGVRSVDGTSLLVDYPGVVPGVDSPLFAVADQSCELVFTGEPGQPYQLLVSLGYGFVSFAPHELPLLANLQHLSPVLTGVADSRGESRLQLVFPSSAAGSYGMPFTLQAFVLRSGRFRFSSVATKIGLP